jgi:hypothetical protein
MSAFIIYHPPFHHISEATHFQGLNVMHLYSYYALS